MFSTRKFILTTCIVLISLSMKAQRQDRIELVKQHYHVLQQKDISTQKLNDIQKSIKWEQIKKVNTRTSICFKDILKKEWQNLLFRELEFKEDEKDLIVVSGIAQGRKATECEYITYKFEHTWTIKNNKIVKFSE